MFGTPEVAVFYKRSPQTIRSWAKEFEEFLSPTANPPVGKVREFTIEDLQVISLIATMKDHNQTYEDIHLALKSGQRGEAPPLNETDVKALRASEGEKRAGMEIYALQQHIVELQQRLNRAEKTAERVGELEQEKAVLEAKLNNMLAQNEQLRRDHEQTLLELKAALEAKGHEYAKGMMEALRQMGTIPQNKPPDGAGE